MSGSDRVVLITGASSGIGEACAEYLGQKGYRVYGTSRRGSDNFPPGRFPALMRMDVEDDASVARGVAHILEKEGRLDVLVNNAGFGIAGAVEDTAVDEARSQLETNFFGVFRLCRQVLPYMRERRSGCIINISSIGGLIGIPFQALYSASKHAVEGLTEALRMEVKKYGVRVVMIEPGDFRTGFTAHRRKTARSQESPVYLEDFHRALQVMEHDEMNGPAPVEIARLVEHIINTPSPGLRYMIGPSSEKMAVMLKKLLPYSLFEWALMKYYRL
jgi:NAD(P)-dependent dehydrogenase (short-subunit alcohol dehydrogenase family)